MTENSLDLFQKDSLIKDAPLKIICNICVIQPSYVTEWNTITYMCAG